MNLTHPASQAQPCSIAGTCGRALYPPKALENP